MGTHAFFFWTARDRIPRGDPDFTVFYTAAVLLREGRASELYDSRAQLQVQREFANDDDIRRGPLPYIHPPFEALIFLPLTLLSYSQAFVVWNLVNLFLLFWIIRLLRVFSERLRAIPSWQLLLASLAFFPVFANFYQGQDSILLLLIVALSFHALERQKEFAAGFWLGLGMFKYHLMVPLFVILAVWRGRRLVAGFMVTGLGTVALSLALVGWHGALEYPKYTWHVISLPGFGRIPFRQLPNLLGLVAGWPLVQDALWVRLAALVLSIGLLIVVARTGRTTSESLFRLSFSCAVIAALLVGYSTNAYDVSLLILPLVLVTDEGLRKAPSAAVALIAPVIPLLVSPVWSFLWMKWQRINLTAIFLLWWLFSIRREIVSRGSSAVESTTFTPPSLI